MKIKLCPDSKCNTANNPCSFICLTCGIDITKVPLSDPPIEDNCGNNAANTAKPIKLCDCGAKNPSNARKCGKCGEDISTVIPTVENTGITYVLRSLDGEYSYCIDCGETIIGRESAMSEYLSSKSFVSRKHIKLILDNNTLYIENLPTTNPTLVNSVKLECRLQLNVGDVISMGVFPDNAHNDKAAYLRVENK